MKICIIGDPHGDFEKIKKIPLQGVDLILITGDLGKSDLMREMYFENMKRKNKGLSEIKYTSAQEKRGFMESYNTTMKLIKYLKKYAPVLTIFGNVESTNKKTKQLANRIKKDLPLLSNDLNKIKDVRIINNKIANINGIRIGGLQYFTDTNWIREFKPSNYKEKMNNAKKETEKAKKVLNWFNEIDILLCHQPPHGFLDKVTFKYGAPKNWHGKHAGSKTILNYIKKKMPKYVFCGHIHEGEGKAKINKTKIYNLGVCNYKIIDTKKIKQNIDNYESY